MVSDADNSLKVIELETRLLLLEAKVNSIVSSLTIEVNKILRADNTKMNSLLEERDKAITDLGKSIQTLNRNVAPVIREFAIIQYQREEQLFRIANLQQKVDM